MSLTRKQLKLRVKYLNRILNRPEEAYTRNENGSVKHGNPGHIMLDYFNPGEQKFAYKLTEIHSSGNGESEWTNYRMTKYGFECYLQGIIDLIERQKYG